jgi:hypothetical protein
MSAMDLITISSAAVLLCVVVFFVAAPLATSRRHLSRQASGTRVRQLTEQKEQLYATIKELEFDRQLGKLLEADYLRLRADVEQQALDLLRILDQLNGGSSKPDVQKGLEQEILQRRESTAPVCPACAIALRPDDLFCSQCGAPLAPQPN